MKVSSSIRPKTVAFALAAAYLALHFPFIAPSLEDVDSINFALGLRDFDPARHQPHPPGYPVYIALGHASLAVLSAVWSAGTRAVMEATALAVWSVIGGAIAIVAAFHLFRALQPDRAGERVAVVAAALVAVSPLFWISGLRPMSDMPGLAVALAAQALILRGTTERRRLVQGAALAGLAIGIRVQTLWLTLPLLLFALVQQRRLGLRVLVAPIAACAAGGLVWGVPLLVYSGGLDGYLGALGTQADEDFAWVNMVWLNPKPRRVAFAVYETFVLPWASIPLAAAVAAAAAAGSLAALFRARRSLGILALAFVPYVVFHLLLQDTTFIRYALPTIPLVAWLAARGVMAAGRPGLMLAIPLVAAALLVAIPGALAYGRDMHPAFRAIGDAAQRARTAPPAAVHAHFAIWRALQAETGALPLVEPRRQYEWLGLVDYWKNGGAAPVWFLADARRTDMDLIDPQSRRDVVRYAWPVASRPEMGGSRPLGVDWYRFQSPGWFAGQGWSLTPETGGLALATATSPDNRPIEAWVRRRPGAMHLMVGGRHLGEATDPAADFELSIDGQIRDRWTLTFAERNFLRFVAVPEGIDGGSGPDATVTIASRAAGGDARRAAVAIRQFDIQPTGQMIYGFGQGWHEEEYDLTTGRRWRWTSERSELRIVGASQAVRITVRGESPLRYFDAPPTVRVTAGGRVIGELRPAADFEWSVTVPVEDLVRAEGIVAIESDRVYLPGPAEGTSDERHLALRLFASRVETVSP